MSYPGDTDTTAHAQIPADKPAVAAENPTVPADEPVRSSGVATFAFSGLWVFIVLALTVFAVAVLMSERVLSLPFQFSTLYNEGWNAFHAHIALSNSALYPPIAPFTVNNYPPLSFYLVGLVGQFTGDNIVTGRFVALLSLLIVAANIALIVRRMSGSTVGGLFAGLLLLGNVAAWYGNYVATNEPQWLAHALATTGVTVLVLGERTHIKVIVACALMLAGGLVKHILIPLPVAVTIGLLIYDRRAFLIWTSAAVVLSAVALGLLYLVYGPAFFQALLGLPRSYKITVMVRQLYLFVVPLFPLILAWLALVAIDFRGRWTRLISLYVMISLLWGIFAVGGIGVTHNAFFDLVIGLSIAAGLFVTRISNHLIFAGIPRPVVQAVAMLMLVQTVVVATPAAFGATIDLLRHGKAENLEAAFADDVQFVAAQEGPAMCENLALCYWAGKDFSVDYFTTGQKVLLGAVDASELVNLVETQHFGAIEVDESRAENLRRLPAEFYQALSEHYVVGKSGPGGMTIYVPKGSDDPAGEGSGNPAGTGAESSGAETGA